MKILFITNKIDGSDGWSRYSKDVINAIKKQGNEVKVMTPGMPLQYLVNPWSIYLLSRSINREIQKFCPEIIHFLVEPYANAAAFIKSKEIKMFVTVHGTFSYIPNLIGNKLKKSISRYFFRRMYSRMSNVIAVSDYTSRHLKAAIGTDFGEALPQEKIIVINNGIDFADFDSKSPQFPVKKKEDLKRIVFVGAVKPRKGLLQSMKALGLYKEKFGAGFEYLIAGACDQNSPYYQSLQDEIENYGLESNVKFLGRISEAEKQGLYAGADVFMMLSVEEGNAPEGFGLVYLEANAFGVPAIGSKNSGAEDAIKDGASGFLVNPNDANEVAAKLNQLLNEREFFRGKAMEWAKEHDISKVAEKMILLYEKS